MKAVEHRVGDIGILYLVGSVNANSADVIKCVMARLIADGGQAAIFNFSRTTNVDLPGWCAVLEGCRLAGLSGLRLAACGFSTARIPLMVLAKLVCVMDPFLTLSEALEASRRVKPLLPSRRPSKAA